MQKEIMALAPMIMKLKIPVPPKSKYSVWIVLALAAGSGATAHTRCRYLAPALMARHHQRVAIGTGSRLLHPLPVTAPPVPATSTGASAYTHCWHQPQSLHAISGWEQWLQELGCWQTEDQGPWQEGPGRGSEDGLRPAPVPTIASWATVPFKVHKFMHWAPNLHLYKSQSNSILKFIKGSTNLTSASLSIAHSIAQHGKALSEGEFIKETLLRCAPVLFHDMQNKDAIIKIISELPLSRNIIKDRIMRLNTNVQHQLKRDIRKCKYFSISLDETTDVTSHAQLAIIGRYSDGLIMRKELIKLVSVSISKSGSEICKVVIQTFRDLSIDISKVVSVTTDGAPNMVGKKSDLSNCLQKLLDIRLCLFVEALCAKAGFTDLNDLMSVVTKIVDLIAARPLHKREFSALLLEVDSTYSGLLMYNNVRWLSRGKVLESLVECFEKLRYFLTIRIWETFLSLMMINISVHINELNLKLQGFGKSIDVIFGYIKAFESKVKIFKRDVETKTYKYFPRVTKYFEKASAAVQK
ncbi:hypothetical protein QTO34_016746 [Cnephaeus nilssonii]|uniref:DUF4371 domain-containing protein n=1 Tax=Cnephaeus nilssonii TaxID=3371016 RepID=A0AA40I2U1_CNENI|nr:hypothetical protein QTO34_016746 [Eptesicus nilssonii]